MSSQGRVAAVDGLRALAMTGVIAYHCSLLPFGWAGVWLFFVISGYVITLGFVKGEYYGASFSRRYTGFIRRRAARIIPVYLLYVLIGSAILMALGGVARLGDVPYLLSFTFNWHMIFDFWPGTAKWDPFGQLWTISVEQQFYLLFPLLAIAMAQQRQVLVTAFLICCGPIVRWAWSQTVAQHLGPDPETMAMSLYVASVCHFDAFLMGSLVAQLQPRLIANSRWGTRLWLVALGVALAYVVVYVLINRSLGAQGTATLRNLFSGFLYGQHREVFLYLAINLLSTAALAHVILNRPGTALLTWRPVVWVGRISYGGYLFHALLLWLVVQALGMQSMKEGTIPIRLATFAGVWVMTVCVASVSFKYFEVPVARYFAKRGAQAHLWIRPA